MYEMTDEWEVGELDTGPAPVILGIRRHEPDGSTYVELTSAGVELFGAVDDDGAGLRAFIHAFTIRSLLGPRYFF